LALQRNLPELQRLARPFTHLEALLRGGPTSDEHPHRDASCAARGWVAVREFAHRCEP